jgi:hypothetical protein
MKTLLWMIVDKKFLVSLFERLPFGSGSFVRNNWRGWEFQDKKRSHLELGDVFVVVNLGRNWLYVCNAEALLDVFKRRMDFPRPPELFSIVQCTGKTKTVLILPEMVNVFGQNLSTVNGQTLICRPALSIMPR